MLSRVANSIYWMARYVERAENLARFLDVTFNLILDQPSESGEQWEPLVYTTGDQAYYEEHYGSFTSEQVIHFLVFDKNYGGSILSCLHSARENARTVREAISSEAWEQINSFYHLVRDAARDTSSRQTAPEFFDSIREQSQLFTGILDATLSHASGWHFANLGRLLERADKTSRILDVKYYTLLPDAKDVGTTIDDLQWSSVLRSVSGFETYRKQFHRIIVPQVVQFLVLDRHFPRAVQFCCNYADESLHAISGSQLNTYQNVAEQKLGRLKSELAYSDVQSIVRSGLHEFIDDLQVKLNDIADTISETFFVRPVEIQQHQTQS
ncbi:MAG: alpha-E domain-containing protein [Pirellulaceae bacterium]